MIMIFFYFDICSNNFYKNKLVLTEIKFLLGLGFIKKKCVFNINGLYDLIKIIINEIIIDNLWWFWTAKKHNYI